VKGLETAFILLLLSLLPRILSDFSLSGDCQEILNQKNDKEAEDSSYLIQKKYDSRLKQILEGYEIADLDCSVTASWGRISRLLAKNMAVEEKRTDLK